MRCPLSCHAYGRQDAAGAALQEDFGNVAPELGGPGAVARGGVADHGAAIGREDAAGEEELGVFERGIGADGDLAAAAEFGEHGAFGANGEMSPGVVEGLAGGASRAIDEGFDGERALAHCGQNDIGTEGFADDVAPAEAAETSGGEDDGVVIAFLDFVDAGIDVATDGLDVKVRTNAFELGDAAEGTGTDARAEFEVTEFAADDGVEGLDALRDAGEGEPFGEFG